MPEIENAKIENDSNVIIDWCFTWRSNDILMEAAKIKKSTQGLDQPLESIASSIRDEINRDHNKAIEVIKQDDKVIGYVIKSFDKVSTVIEEYAFRDTSNMEAFIKNEIGKRPYIFINLREEDLDSQIMFRNLGFKALYIKRGFYGNDSDAYIFVKARYLYPEPEMMGYNEINFPILSDVLTDAEKLQFKVR